ncbi:MAG: acetolactate synthase large subunit [Acidimicrobiales bacterium]
MNGARSLVETLVASGVDVCFANPGTSEMHFVATLDEVRSMRAILALFEGVATGAADGYGRVAGVPAATLLHLGPGLGNGIANLHNAKRAKTPVVNVVGDHATFHKRYDAPLESDIESLARSVSGWYRSSARPDDVAGDALDAVDAAFGPPGCVATLVLPADVSWSQCRDLPVRPRARRTAASVPQDAVDTAASTLRSKSGTAILLGGTALTERSLLAAGKISAATGAKLLCETFPSKIARGAGLPDVERLGYLAEFTQAQLEGLNHLIIVDTNAPVSFFAYPGHESYLVPPGCEVHTLARSSENAPLALESLVESLAATTVSPVVSSPKRPDPPTGALTIESLAAAVGALLPEDAIVVDEANTAGIFIPGVTSGSPRHDWLTLTGGAIGQGIPVATGAGVAARGRRVVSLEADGSAMYTIQGLWTQAREGSDVTTIVFANHSYAILHMELSRVGAAGGEKAKEILDLTGPELDFVSIATGLGVPATKATTADDFYVQLARSFHEPGPSLIEAVLA